MSNKTKFSISEASRVWGVARSTLSRQVATGKLTADSKGNGKPTVIDFSEMIRVHGEPINTIRSEAIPVAEVRPLQVEVAALKRENNLLSSMLAKSEERERELLLQNGKLTDEISRRPVGRLLSWLR